LEPSLSLLGCCESPSTTKLNQIPGLLLEMSPIMRKGQPRILKKLAADPVSEKRFNAAGKRLSSSEARAGMRHMLHVFKFH
jgi:hypothetical protein